MRREATDDLFGLDPWLARWGLEPDGPAFSTRTGHFRPVRLAGEPAMLKVSTAPDERQGARVLAWWDGVGTARVLAYEGDAVVLERATGERSLASMARLTDGHNALTGHGADATTILCQVAAELHAKDPADRPDEVIDLRSWFQALWPAAAARGGVLELAAPVADSLLDSQRDLVVLHGDIHHGNVLDFGNRGFLAIDPKGLYGERTFDFVNILRNPDAETALTLGRFASSVATIALVAEVNDLRLVKWALAFTALSAAWIYEDGDEPTLDLAVAGLAIEYLEQRSGSPLA